MNTDRKQEIKAKAKEINNLSEQFQLVHATYASQEYIKAIVKDFYQVKLSELKTKISDKIARDLDTDQEMEEKEELETLIKQSRYAIDIGYIDIADDNIARAIKTGNSFTIYLAKSLKNSIRKPDGSFNYEVIKKIRKLMSHEIGHMVLHTKELLLEEGTQGSLNINTDEKENEADFFGNELLFLRQERNKQIRRDGGAENLF